jgi:hypothetical protein
MRIRARRLRMGVLGMREALMPPMKLPRARCAHDAGTVAARRRIAPVRAPNPPLSQTT